MRLIEVSLYFIHRPTARGRDTRHHRESSDYFEYPPKNLYLNQATLRILAKLSYQKEIPESTISNQKKFLRSSPSLKNGSPPRPPPPPPPPIKTGIPPPPPPPDFSLGFLLKDTFFLLFDYSHFKELKHQIKGRKLLDLKSSF